MSKDLEQKLEGLNYWGYYEDDRTFTLEIMKEDIIKFLKKEFDVDNLKIV